MFDICATKRLAMGNGRNPPTEASKPAVCYVRFTSTPDVQSLGTSVARRVDLTRSKLLSGTVGPGATFPYRLWQLSHGLRAFPDGPRRPGLRPTATSTVASRQNAADKSVISIALGRWCTLGQTHYPVLGDKGPAIPAWRRPLRRPDGSRRARLPVATASGRGCSSVRWWWRPCAWRRNVRDPDGRCDPRWPRCSPWTARTAAKQIARS
jgi:hypothetical protein